MLHIERSRGWNQWLYLPDCPTSPQATLSIGVLGRLRGTGHFDFRQRSKQYALHVVQAGSGQVTLNGRHHRVTAGDAFLFHPGVEAHYTEDPAKPWRYTWVALVGTAVQACCDAAGFTIAHAVHHDVASAALWRCFDEIEQAFASGAHGPCRAPAAAWQVLDLLGRHHAAANRGDAATALARIIAAGFGSGLRLGALADDLHMDRSTLFRRFRDAYGSSPRQFVLRARLERAHLLLQRGDMTVREAAQRCGFNDVRGFTRAFAARYGTTPGRLRRGT